MTPFDAIKAALKIAEIPCDDYPTCEGWEEERKSNTKTVQRAYRDLSALRALISDAVTALEQAKRPHAYNCNNVCWCGAVEHNARIDAALTRIRDAMKGGA